jgi:hypothetical protein
MELKLKPSQTACGIIWVLAEVRRERGAPQAAEKLDAEGGGGFNPRVKPTELVSALAAEGSFASPTPNPEFFRSLFSTTNNTHRINGL